MIRRLPALVVAAVLAFPSVTAAQTDAQSATLPLTTKSPKARRLLDEAWILAVDQVEQTKAIAVLQKAVKADPDFAIAHEILAQTSLDPAEQVGEQKKASATKAHASSAEQTIVDWFQNAADHNLIPAITSMNEVLRQYPHDRWVVYLANNWLTLQTQYERANEVYEKSGITDSPGLINNVAYTYAYMRQFDKSFVLMDKYITALPKDANPQDSYAEILRMAGHFDEAIEHYKIALSINQQFYSSHFGIADTYSLMGDQARAREEYDAAFQKFPLPELHRIQWRTRAAITYIREGDIKSADSAFKAIADYAHSKHMSQVEADTDRQIAIYQPHTKQALFFLNKAESALHEGNNTMPGAIQQEFAQILRARVETLLRTGDFQMAKTTLAQLAQLSDSSDDKLIETAYHGAAGAVLFAQHQYKDAALQLEEDIQNPMSLKLLAQAYHRTGDVSDAKRIEDTLANLNDPTLEQALVVPAFRKCLESPSCHSSMKNVTFKH